MPLQAHRADLDVDAAAVHAQAAQAARQASPAATTPAHPHGVRWDGPTPVFECSAEPGHWCRTACAEGCVEQCVGDPDTGRGHEVGDTDCNLLPWLNDGHGRVLYDGPAVVAYDGPITITWTGTHFRWTFATAPAVAA